MQTYRVEWNKERSTCFLIDIDIDLASNGLCCYDVCHVIETETPSAASEAPIGGHSCDPRTLKLCLYVSHKVCLKKAKAWGCASIGMAMSLSTILNNQKARLNMLGALNSQPFPTPPPQMIGRTTLRAVFSRGLRLNHSNKIYYGTDEIFAFTPMSVVGLKQRGVSRLHDNAIPLRKVKTNPDPLLPQHSPCCKSHPPADNLCIFSLPSLPSEEGEPMSIALECDDQGLIKGRRGRTDSDALSRAPTVELLEKRRKSGLLCNKARLACDN